MNNYVRKLFGVLFPSQPTPQIVRIQPSRLPTSPEEWRQYWQSQDQPWRTEPEIDAKRQEELSRHRAVSPDIDKGIYPFKGMKLSRADVEWLLATHENGRGPVIWSDESQRSREGLDLRGADLRDVDLHQLPLARLRAGLTYREWPNSTVEQRNWAVARLENANLREAQLAGAYLRWTHLTGTYLRWANLEEADLRGASLAGTYLRFARLERADLREAQLAGANLISAKLEGAYLTGVIMGDQKGIGPWVADTIWGNVNLAVVQWSQVKKLRDEYDALQGKLSGQVKDRTILWFANRFVLTGFFMGQWQAGQLMGQI